MGLFTSLSFTKKYIFALSLIATFSILAYFNLSNILNSQRGDGEVINISGRQRMLSQRIALFSIYYKTKKLRTILKHMEDSHNDLISRPMSKEIHDIYFAKPIELDRKVKGYLKNAKVFAEHLDGRSLNYILINSETLLKDLDTAVFAYQKEAKEKVNEMQKNESILLSFVLITLILEGLLIFRPINNSVKKRTKELTEEKKFSDTVTQINTNAIIAIDNYLNILTFNQSAENIFGYTREEMEKKNSLDCIIPPKYLKEHKRGIENFVKNKRLKNAGAVYELEGLKKDGTLFPIRISFGVKIGKEASIIVANIQDISKEKEKDNLIIHQSRYAAMGEMIGNIAHQWRQPLSSISAIASGAKIRYKNNLISDEELDETFDKIKEHTLYLSKTIDDFRGFFLKDRNKDTFDIMTVVNRSITLTEASFSSNKINLIVEKDYDEVLIDGSDSELSQVYLNVLNNAKDALVSKDVQNRIVLFKVTKDDKNAIVRISDNAGGIPENIRLKIFEPYFTTKHKSNGTGIGLFMSKRIVEEHFAGVLEEYNKEFFAEGEKYFGAEFIIKIPLHVENSQKTKEA